jgi:hypothetical protein
MSVVLPMLTNRCIAALSSVFCHSISTVKCRPSPFDLITTDACVLILNQVGLSNAALPKILMLRAVCEEWRRLIDTEFETMGRRVAHYGPTLRGPARFLSRMNHRWHWTMEAFTVRQIQTLAARISISIVFIKTKTDELEPMMRCLTIMPALQSLVIMNQATLRTLDSLCGLTSLTNLTVSNCTQLSALDSISGLPRLSVLTLINLPCVTNTDCTATMHNLTMVTIDKCGITGNLSELNNHKHLASVKLRNLNSIVTLGTIIDNLQALSVVDAVQCDGIRTLGFTRTLTNLTMLTVCLNSRLRGIDSVAFTLNLRVVNFTGCTWLRKLTNIALLQRLEIIHIDHCKEIESVLPLIDCTALNKVNMQHCVSVPCADVVVLKMHIACVSACYPWPCSLCMALQPAD